MQVAGMGCRLISTFLIRTGTTQTFVPIADIPFSQGCMVFRILRKQNKRG
jgi:hypothetical protein